MVPYRAVQLGRAGWRHLGPRRGRAPLPDGIAQSRDEALGGTLRVEGGLQLRQHRRGPAFEVVAFLGIAGQVVELPLGLGRGTGEAFGCPLTEAYVRENSEYTT